MSFVEKANASLDEIKTNFGASDYATKTSGTRHSPPMAPLGEGVYAIISNGREVSIPKILNEMIPIMKRATVSPGVHLDSPCGDR